MAQRQHVAVRHVLSVYPHWEAQRPMKQTTPLGIILLLAMAATTAPVFSAEGKARGKAASKARGSRPLRSDRPRVPRQMPKPHPLVSKIGVARGICVALGDKLYTAVGEITDESLDIKSSGQTAGRISKTDTLNLPTIIDCVPLFLHNRSKYQSNRQADYRQLSLGVNSDYAWAGGRGRLYVQPK